MLKCRVIPALLISDGGLVKTLRFEKPEYIGDPINAVKIFNQKEVDELIIIDIDASKAGVGPNYNLIERIAGECFMPLTYGGINTVEQAKRIIALGVEKVCIQTGAFENPRLISDIAESIGEQSVVISIDIKRDWRGEPKVYQSINKKKVRGSWLENLDALTNSGVGEVLINVVDKDGTLLGPDIGIATAASKVSQPLIYLGGVSNLQDIKSVAQAGASAVAAGAFLFSKVQIEQY